MSTLPLIFATAIYGLCDRANVRSGESVLIHSGAGGVGIAPIQIAHLKAANVYATVSTEEKKDFLVDELRVKRKNIDVILNSLTGDLLHDSWRCCARFGKFVEIGKRDVTDAERLDMQVFKRNVMFTAFDVSELCDLQDPALSTTWARYAMSHSGRPQ